MQKVNSSMQLTRAADYAVRVMVYLAGRSPETRLSLPELAHEAETPVSFLSKVLQSLTRAGFVSSRRGQTGGFSLSPRGRVASMREVIEAVDGPIRLNVCLSSGSTCPRRLWCPAHPVWARAQRAMLEVLENAKIAEMAGRPAAAHRGGLNPALASLPAHAAR
ncbi:MAG: RrF2 family transcriptional regulator [Acidobacteriota bacterium]